MIVSVIVRKRQFPLVLEALVIRDNRMNPENEGFWGLCPLELE